MDATKVEEENENKEPAQEKRKVKFKIEIYVYRKPSLLLLSTLNAGYFVILIFYRIAMGNSFEWPFILVMVG